MQTPTFEQLPALVSTLIKEVEIIKGIVEKIDRPIESPINVNEAAEYLQLDVQTIYRLLRDKSLPAHKKYSRWYFFKSELREHIKTLNQ